LASTDLVVLRKIVRDQRIPRPVRQELKIEAGMNDLVVLPVVLVLIAVATDQAGGATDWAIFLAKLLVLGPAIGFAVGGVGSWLVVQAGIPGSELLLATVGVVVITSIAIHGGTATPVGAWYGRIAARETLAEERETTVAGLFGNH
jgi:NhaP-type Na+/H+ or K+/H+ antiporter